MDEKTPDAPQNAPQNSLQIVLAHNAEQLKAHIAAWDDLAAHAVEPNVFYESWHFLPALQVFGDENSLFVLIFANQRTKNPLLCGFFPLQKRRRYKGVPVRVLALWNHDYCSLCTPLVRAGYENECLDSFFAWLNNHSGAALLTMEEFSAAGTFHRFWMETLYHRGALSFVDEIHARAFLQPSDESADGYFYDVLSRKRRKELKRRENRLRELGCLKYELIAGDALEQGISEFLQLEAAGWKGRAGTALANQEAHRTFFREVATGAARRGRLMLLCLRLDERPLAMKFNLLAGEGAFACKIAFDEDYARYSPGILLELENIRCLQENPDLHWMDSCALPDHPMINNIWAERRLMQNFAVSTGQLQGDLVVSLLPLLRFIKRRAKRTKKGEIHVYE